MRRSRRAIRSRRSASEVAIEQHPVTNGFLHKGSWLLGAPGGFTAGVQNQVNREIGLGHCAPEISEQGKAVAAGQPGIWSDDQQVHVGIRAGLTAGPGAEEAHFGRRNQLADGGRHGGEAFLNRCGWGQGHGAILVEAATSDASNPSRLARPSRLWQRRCD